MSTATLSSWAIQLENSLESQDSPSPVPSSSSVSPAGVDSDGFQIVEDSDRISDAKREDSLWFHDGTVVLQAGLMLFKLHTSILGSRSRIFDNFLNWGQLSESSAVTFLEAGKFEGDQVVQLADDGQEAKYFFMSIYDSGFFERPPATTSYEVVLAVLKLSTKYEVGYLRKRALAHLSLAYPLSLDQWDKRETVSTLSAENDVDAWLGSKATSKTLNVIAAAEGLNLPWLLPALFYELSTATLELLLHDSKWNDGSIDPKTKHNILVGYYEQTNATQSRMLNFLYCDPLERCSSKDVCGEVRRRVYCDSQIWLKTKPLEVMEDGDWDPFLGDLCALCLQVSKVRFQQARQEFWETLPEIYGLPKWEVLVGLHEDDVGQSQAMLQVGD